MKCIKDYAVIEFISVAHQVATEPPSIMKSIIFVALAIVAIAVAAPPADQVPQTIHQEYNKTPSGGYNFGFETENGISRQENGELKDALDEDNKPLQIVTVRGSYTYINIDGTPETVNYYADETGFHAEGASIPKNPEQ